MKTTASEKSISSHIKQWWKGTDFRQMEYITGFRQYEYNPENGYQEFVDACDNYWNRLDREEKIRIWEENKDLTDNFQTRYNYV